jgi:hypothetical protein
MQIEIENTAESLLKIEYNGREYSIAGNSISQIDVDSLEFNLSAYLTLPKEFDLEQDKNGIKEKLIQKSFDKLYSLSKKMIVQCRTTYAIKLNSDSAKLVFSYDFFGKEQSFTEDFFDMPLELSSFARLECDYAEILVIDCEALNKKQFMKTYKIMYWWVNWNLGLIALLLYLPPYIKQKKMVSKNHLTKVISSLYSVSREERDKLLGIEENHKNSKSSQETVETMQTDKTNSKKGCLKTFIGLGIFVLISIVILVFIIAWIVIHIRYFVL